LQLAAGAVGQEKGGFHAPRVAVFKNQLAARNYGHKTHSVILSLD
jgi:hypothetical protein